MVHRVPHDTLKCWYEEHATQLCCWARVRISATARLDFDVEDLLQEVWLRASRHESEEAIQSPRAWLFGIAARVLQEFLRSALRRQKSAGPSIVGSGAFELPADITSITQRVVRDEFCQRLVAIIAALPEDERAIAVKHGLEGQPLAKIAHSLRITVAAAQKRWLRLRNKLAESGLAVAWV